TGVEKTGNAVTGVTTESGRVSTDAVVVCAGIWGMTVGAMAGIEVPVMPMEHQSVQIGPIEELASAPSKRFPTVRLHDDLAYCRSLGDLWWVGSYNHPPLPVEPEELQTSWIDGLAPSIRPFTPVHFQDVRDSLNEVFPSLRDRPVANAFNGM